VIVRTTIVLFMLLETTSPVRVLRAARVAGSACVDVGDGDSCSAMIYFP
jgi:hypothetical protein